MQSLVMALPPFYRIGHPGWRMGHPCRFKGMGLKTRTGKDRSERSPMTGFKII